MAAPDPASEALIRKLHRELNGFTRRSRYPPQPENPGPRKVQQDRKGPDSVTPSEDQSDKGLNSRPTSEGDQPSADHGKAKAKREKPDAAERPAKLARRTSPTNAGGATEDKSRAGADKAVAVAAAAPPPVPVLPLTPLEEAAALASAMTRTKTKQASRPSQAPAAGLKVIKCFHAGIRWGITLTADAIKRRSDLATALNDAFAGQILSCGRGDMLHVVFLDETGQAEEFPALRSDIKESASQWKACVDKAVRVYVMR